MSSYYVSAGDDRWNKVRSKTLTSAKAMASRIYQPSVGGKIFVGQMAGEGDQARIERVAVKHGFDGWSKA